jgi:hypothetical protein
MFNLDTQAVFSHSITNRGLIGSRERQVRPLNKREKRKGRPATQAAFFFKGE